jgi:glutamyl-tRNA reductase
VSIVVVSLDHRSVPFDVLERMSVPNGALPKALHDLRSREHIGEAVVLSTCNRTEVYVVAETFHGALADVESFLVDLSGLAAERFVPSLVTAYDVGAARHLFGVTSGLRSAVVGETEILGQARGALAAAHDHGSVGPRLDALFRHALEVGKRARSETAIARGTASVSQAAVELAQATLETLAGRSVLVLGAGEIGVAMAQSLQHAGAADVRVANRSGAKARALAAQVRGRHIELHELPTALAEVDLLLTATSADGVVLGRDDLEAVMASRGGRPLVAVDAALPRDIDPAAADLPGLTLLDLASIRAFVDRGLAARRDEIRAVTAIIAEEVERYEAGAAAREIAPVIVALRARADEVRAAELRRFLARAGSELTAEQAEAVEAMTRQLVAKLLHTPTVRLKESASTVRGIRHADAVRQLFDLS